MICPFCTSTNVERDDQRPSQWFCKCCSRVWIAFTENDKGFLKGIRVSAE